MSKKRRTITRQRQPRASGTTIGRQWRDRMIALLQDGIASLADKKLAAPRRVQKGRQATKAVRALLRLAPAGVRRQSRGVSLALSTVRRHLGATRDADALVETFERVAAGLEISLARKRAFARNLAPRGAPDQRALADSIAEAVDMLSKIVVQISRWNVPASRDVSILDAIADDYRRLKRDARGGLQHLEIDALHELRKRVITHRHQLAFLASLPHARTRRIEKRVERARKLHEAIGEHRDLELLARHLAAGPAQSTIPPNLNAQIEKMQAFQLKRAMRLASRLLTSRVKDYRVTAVSGPKA